MTGHGIELRFGGGSTHAWCQVYLPGAGWVEFDPTNGIVGNRDLIRVAVARVNPGRTAFTRIPEVANCCALVWTRLITPAFDAE